MKTKLTDRLIRTRKPPATGRLIITDTAVPGLSLRINPASSKNPDGLRYWFLRYRPRHQVQRSTVLGPCPPLGLAEARLRGPGEMRRILVGGARQRIGPDDGGRPVVLGRTQPPLPRLRSRYRQVLWESIVGGMVMTTITYAVNGKQYVAIFTGEGPIGHPQPARDGALR
jgi:hypothetical protein